MSTVSMTDESSFLTKKTRHITCISEKNKTIVDNCDICIGTSFFNPEEIVLYFKTDKKSCKILEERFGNRIFTLKVITNGYFPTLIKLDKGWLYYEKFLDLLKNKEIQIIRVDTTIRRLSLGQHKILYNRVNKIICESI